MDFRSSSEPRAGRRPRLGGGGPLVPNIGKLIYPSAALLLVGIVLFVGGIFAILAKLIPLGGGLMAASIASLFIAYVLLRLGIRRLRAFNRDLPAREAQQMADLEAAFRDRLGGGRLPG